MYSSLLNVNARINAEGYALRAEIALLLINFVLMLINLVFLLCSLYSNVLSRDQIPRYHVEQFVLHFSIAVST